jgi:transmembrane sensor
VHNEKKPFKVLASGVEIEDLGTEFNVNSYTDEPDMKVTLVSGLLQVKSKGADKLVTPGQQARISDMIRLVKNADLPSELAWKNGFFSFREADIKTVMRQVARWYDIEVGYEGATYQGTFTGRIGKDLSLKDLLDGLTRMQLKFRIEGNHVVIQ